MQARKDRLLAEGLVEIGDVGVLRRVREPFCAAQSVIMMEGACSTPPLADELPIEPRIVGVGRSRAGGVQVERDVLSIPYEVMHPVGVLQPPPPAITIIRHRVHHAIRQLNRRDVVLDVPGVGAHTAIGLDGLGVAVGVIRVRRQQTGSLFHRELVGRVIAVGGRRSARHLRLAVAHSVIRIGYVVGIGARALLPRQLTGTIVGPGDAVAVRLVHLSAAPGIVIGVGEDRQHRAAVRFQIAHCRGAPRGVVVRRPCGAVSVRHRRHPSHRIVLVGRSFPVRIPQPF